MDVLAQLGPWMSLGGVASMVAAIYVLYRADLLASTGFRSLVKDLHSEIERLRKQIGSLEDRLGDSNREIRGLTDRLSAAKREMVDLEDQVDEANGK